MGFFNSIGQVVSNRKTFKQWEKDDADRAAQRQALAKEKPASEQELKNAAAKGKVMMDIVDIMDTHSEEVAENTETAVMPFAMLVPLVTGGLSAFALNKFSLKPAKTKFDNATNTFLASDKGIELFKISKDLRELAANGAEDIQKLHGSDLELFSKKNLKILSQSKNKQVQEFYSRILTLRNAYKNTPGIKNYNKTVGIAGAIFGAISLGSFIASNIYAAKIQVKSSRIARWQSREDLKDPKYFVQYTDEQIQTAKENMEQNGTKAEKGFFSFFKKSKDKSGFKYNDRASLIATLKDNKSYDKWKTEYNLDERKVKRPLTKEEIIEAEKDQEVIQRVTKIINNKAEEYSENMETAAGVLIGATPFLGMGIGALINTIVTKSGLGEKFSDKNLNKLLSESAVGNIEKAKLKNTYEELKATDGQKLGLIGLANKIVKQCDYISDLWNATKQTAPNATGLSKALDTVKRLKNVAFTTKYGRNMVIGYAGTIVTGIVGALIGLKLQKASARAGRYKAKRELQQDSNNFIGYTNEQFSQVSNVKAEKKSALAKFGNYMTFIPRVIKDYRNYEKYRKTQAKQDKELLNELVKLDVSDKQLKEAKNLQRKLFTTFESVDDKSQEYSESVEAVNEMSQPFLPYLALGIASIPLVIGGLKIKKGGAPKIVETVTSFLAKHTAFLKGKSTNKYCNEVSQNISSIVEMQKLAAPEETKARIMEIINKISGDSNEAKVIKDILNSLQSIKGQDNELKAFLNMLAENPMFKNTSKAEMSEALNSLSELLSSSSEIFKLMPGANEAATKIISELSNVTESCDNFSEAARKLLDKYGDRLPKDVKISDYANIVDTIKGKINTEAVWQFGGKIKNSVKTPIKATLGAADAALKEEIKNGNWRELGKKLKDIMPSGSVYQRLINNIINSSMTDEQALKIYKNIQIILDNMPKEESTKIMKTCIDEFAKNPQKFMQALNDGDLSAAFLTKGVVAIPVVGSAAYTALTVVFTFITESIFASMQKQAGRLGVMKALEELKDVEYYANEEPSEVVSQSTVDNKQAEPVNNPQNIQAADTYNDFSKLSPAFSKFTLQK